MDLAAVFRELWLSAPATQYADAAARELRGLEARGVSVPPTPAQRIERAEKVVAAGLGDQARAEAEAVLAEGPPVDLALKALRVVMDGAAKALRENEDVKEFYLGVAEGKRKSFRDVKHYKRRKRWLA